MLVYLAFGLAALAALVALLRLYVAASPRLLVRVLGWTVGIAAVAGAGLFLIRGNLGLVTALLAMASPMLARWRLIRDAARAWRGPRAGQQSAVGARFVEMTLDHDSGVMEGRVLEGEFAGRFLSELSAAELDRLMAEADTDSIALIRAWRQRMRADEPEAPPPPAAGGPMSRAEALAVLGLAEGADEAAIREAHRRLMLANHPDRGGSDWLAARINQARDVLLGPG
ncbi:MAG: DnaJ domain-containing protein [Thalassobaculales bacterium]